MSGAAFHKVSGGGNDFILLDGREPDEGTRLEDRLEAMARSLCVRGLSVGADGVVLVQAAEGADLRITYRNADGSRAFCGNATLCVARWAQAVAGLPSRLKLQTDCGILEARVSGGRVDLQVPAPGGIRDGIPLGPAGMSGEGVLLDTGCPHLVVLVPSLPDDAELAARAPALRHHPDLAPDGANVDFVSVEDPHRLRMRVWERGVEGETLASGTGCLASALGAAVRNLSASPVSCLTRGGSTFKVRFKRTPEGAFESVSLEGSARLVYSGSLSADALER